MFENTTVLTEVAGESFRSRGKVMLEAGWRAVYGEAPPTSRRPRARATRTTADQVLPPLEEGEKVRCTEVASDARETKPPPRYGEAALLAAMEGAGKLVEDDELREAMKDSGIGTPATRASIIERLIDVGYIVRDGRRLQPTGKGIQVIDLLGEHELTSPSLTGDWEHRLLDIERAGGSREAFMRDIAKFTEKTVAYLRDLPSEALRFQRRELDIICPRCGEGHLIENAKGFGCSTWKSAEEPGCGFVIWKSIGGKQLTEDIVRDVDRGRQDQGADGLPLEPHRPSLPRHARTRPQGRAHGELRVQAAAAEGRPEGRSAGRAGRLRTRLESRVWSGGGSREQFLRCAHSRDGRPQERSRGRTPRDSCNRSKARQVSSPKIVGGGGSPPIRHTCALRSRCHSRRM